MTNTPKLLQFDPSEGFINKSDMIAMISSAIAYDLGQTIPGVGDDVAIRIAVAAHLTPLSNLTTQILDVELEITNDQSIISIGDSTFLADLTVDSIATVAATEWLNRFIPESTILGNEIGLYIAVGTALVYNKIVDPITESTILALNGGEVLYLRNPAGENIAGYVYPDGIPVHSTSSDNYNFAITDFIGVDALTDTDLNNMSIKVNDSTLANSYTYYFSSASVLDNLTSHLGTTTSEILPLGINVNLITSNNAGEYFYFEEDNGTQTQLTLPVTVNGQSSTYKVQKIAKDNVVQWGGSNSSAFDLNYATSSSTVLLTSPGVNNDLLIGATGDIAETFDISDSLLTSNNNDLVIANGGNDTILVSAGHDIIDGGTGSDWVDYTARMDNDIIVDLTGGLSTIKNLIFEDDSQQLYNIENIITGNGDDSITGNDVANVINTGGGEDTVHGGDGNDTITASGSESSLYGGLGDDRIYIGFGKDNVFGEEGNDYIVSGQSTYKDTINGGDGDDTVDYSFLDQFQSANIDLLTGDADIHSNLDNTLTNIESIITGASNDTISGNIKDNTFISNAGNDSLIGLAGNDIFVAGAGNDIIDGGIGFDWLKYEGDVAQGIDVTIDVSLSSTLTGFTGGVTEVINVALEDTVNGVTILNPVTGNDGFTGIDGIIATNYDDTITIDEDVVGGQMLSLYLGLGNNTINLSNDDDTTLNFFFNTTKLQDDSNGTFANSLAAGTLSIYGHGGNDDIYGSAFADTIVGGQGDDTLRGGLGGHLCERKLAGGPYG